MILTPRSVEIKHGHIFCGIGGGAKGFNKSRPVVGNATGTFRCLGGIDCDKGAIANFERATKVKGTVLDLFTRAQFEAFHGRPAPADYREAMPADVRRAWNYETPNIAFGSAPCKAFSGLLSEAKSKTDKYDALNQLSIRGLRLALEAYADDPIDFWLWENVPRIQTRGRAVLDQMIALLADHGYAVNETTHDCGEIGGLGQHRKRFLLVARHRDKVPPFLYEPPKRRVRSVGEVIGAFPVPGAVPTLPMHRLPMLQWQTWVRLAFVKAGGDWRSLNELQVADGVLKDYALVPSAIWHNGALGVAAWDQSAGTVTSNGRPATGVFSVADPRSGYTGEYSQIGVRDWKKPAGTVSGQMQPGGGPHSIADPRYENFGEHYGKMRVEDFDKPAHVITGSDRVGSGALSVADPRLHPTEDFGQYGVNGWKQTGATVTSQRAPGQGRFSVADPRILGRPRFNHVFRIVPWSATAPTIAGAGGSGGGLIVADPRAHGEREGGGKYKVSPFDGPAGTVLAASTTGEGAFAVADPRTGYGEDTRKHVIRVTPWEESAGTVTGGHAPSNGALCVADPRTGYSPEAHHSKFAVQEWEEPGRTVTSSNHVTGGAMCVADPLVGGLRNTGLGVKDWDESSGVVAGESMPTNGAFAVADPRPRATRDGKDVYKTQGEYGVNEWDAAAAAVTAHGQHDNGKWTVADPREPRADMPSALPGPKDRLVAVIQALDGTYHRPFTTLELAALQSLVDPDEILELEGKSDSAWREWIGNCVPPDAAEQIGNVMGQALLLAWAGETFALSATPVWVQPIAVALSVKEFDEQGYLHGR